MLGFVCSKECTTLLADLFSNFRNISLEIYRLGSAHFLSTQGLLWRGALTKTKVKLDLLKLDLFY